MRSMVARRVVVIVVDEVVDDDYVSWNRKVRLFLPYINSLLVNWAASSYVRRCFSVDEGEESDA